MEIEKTLTVAAPQQQVWDLLLDPQVMGGCVPGMKSIEVISPTEYVAVMHQKIAFVSAKFKLRTTIVDQRAPDYLRAEGTGEDASVASSLKQQSEIFLTPTPEGGTELRIKVSVDVLGRLGSFGLSVMKTKADRMWEEFGANLAARIDGTAPPSTVTVVNAAPASQGPAAAASAAGAPAVAKVAAPGVARVVTPITATAAAATIAAAERPGAVAAAGRPSVSLPGQDAAGVTAAGVTTAAPSPASPAAPSSSTREVRGNGWWGRLFGGGAGEGGPAPIVVDGPDTIHVEVVRGDTRLSVRWPGQRAAECAAWLRDYLK